MAVELAYKDIKIEVPQQRIVVFGRDPERVDVNLENELESLKLLRITSNISGVHFRLYQQGEDYIDVSVEDVGTNGKGSSKGTYHNSKKLEVGEIVKVNNNDRIACGNEGLEFRVLIFEQASGFLGTTWQEIRNGFSKIRHENRTKPAVKASERFLLDYEFNGFYQLPEDFSKYGEGYIVGRKGDVEVGDDSVSRRHLKFTEDGGIVSVTNISSGNTVLIETKPLNPGEQCILNTGLTHLFLGGNHYCLGYLEVK